MSSRIGANYVRRSPSNEVLAGRARPDEDVMLVVKGCTLDPVRVAIIAGLLVGTIALFVPLVLQEVRPGSGPTARAIMTTAGIVVACTVLELFNRKRWIVVTTRRVVFFDASWWPRTVVGVELGESSPLDLHLRAHDPLHGSLTAVAGGNCERLFISRRDARRVAGMCGISIGH